MRFLPAMLLIGALTLAACGRKDEAEEAPAINNVVEAPVEAEMPSEDDVKNVVQNVTPPAPPPPSLSELEQIHDDADASGLTSRIPQEDEGAGRTGNESQPAE